MKKYTICMMLITSVLLGILLTGCSFSKFEAIADTEVFENVPMMSGETINFSEVEDVGDGNYMVWAYDTTMSEYETYLKTLEENGFSKHVDNGEGLEGYVYTTHYLKDDLLVVVTYFTKLGDTMITACKEAALSEHLFYKDEYVANNIKDLQTSLTMPELYDAGSSFVFQLKNGHFIINDGAYEEDLPYLLDYLESLTPEGEKPVVEAWIISHTHMDHMGVLVGFTTNPKYCNRLYVEGMYYTNPSEEAHEGLGQLAGTNALKFYVDLVPGSLKTTDGDTPKVYRMREGERYYFNDITMDVAYTQDMLGNKEWKTWNASSTVLTYTIENQKVMLTADMDYECQMLLVDVFDDEYFDMTVYQAPHHGGNVYNAFSAHLTTDSVLYPCAKAERSISSLQGRWTQNKYLQSMAAESLDWIDGGVVLRFPYEVGSYEKLPMIDWKHSKELPARLQK